MNNINVYFSDFFNIDKEIIDDYGAIDISLINDLPLFIDPFLLFNSSKEEYKKIHNEIIDYLLFLQKNAKNNTTLSPGMRDSWFKFSEIKQTWLGFSVSGNSGLGMGDKFANDLFYSLKTIFSDFSQNTISKDKHLEKLCLISPNVGRDKISDFTTNFVKRYLLEYTEKFAKEYLSPDKCKKCTVRRAYFNWDTLTWASQEYYLPFINGDFVLLTPKDILTKDDTFINRPDMIEKLEDIAPSVSDSQLRFELNQYIKEVLHKKGKKIKKTERNEIAFSLIEKNPELIDYYIRYKEDHKEEATSISKENVKWVELLFNKQISDFIKILDKYTDFYKIPDAHEEAKKRILFLKHVIEDQEGYKLFYIDGTPIKRESDLQVIYRLVWYGTPLDVNREVNNGRGPVDYKISYGKNNSTLIEFKLASNTKLKNNIAKQVEVYKKASDAERAIKVIMFFTEKEEEKLYSILRELELNNCDDIILIDARNDNKPSASNVKI